MNRRFFLKATSAALAASRLQAAPAGSRYMLYMGTRDPEKGKVIYSCSFDSKTGACGPVSRAADLEQPTWMVASADARFLYSVSETGNDGKTEGGLAAFTVDRQTGALKLLNRVSAGGGGSTFVALDRTGKTALVANFGSGRTTAFRVLADGRLGEKTASMDHSGTGPHRRQTAPHAHAVVVSPDNRFALTPDLGADRVFVFRLDAATGGLTPNDPPFASVPPGFGPRQMVFRPDGKFAYLLDELVAKITVFAWDAAKGSLSSIQTVSTQASSGPGEPSGAGIAMHPTGRFLYTTTRNDSAVEMFAVDKSKGTLVARQQVPARGMGPWSCALDPAGRYLAAPNQGSDSAAIFGIDPGTGDLKPVGGPLSVPAPACALFVPLA
jgi:6-phosphogluconolactonase